MKDDKYRKYIYWGMTAFLVISACIAFIFLIVRIDRVKVACSLLTSILAPITYGAVLAYLLTPVYNRVRNLLVKWLKPAVPKEGTRLSLSKAGATIASIVVLIAIIVGLFSMLIPQLIKSAMSIVEALPTSVNNLQIWLQQILADNPELEQRVMEHYGMAVEYLQNWVTNDMLPTLSRVISGLSSGLFTLVIALKNILIGVIVMVYLLNMKEKLITQSKMIVYSAFPLKAANKIVEEFRFVHHVFGGFIIGKLLDSLIIGIMSFVLLSWMKMPYELLVSVIIGVTNVIPFFGPFIGAIPSAFLILLVSPVKCLYFIGFILLLQQFDGNILGPKILGDSTGLSSFWVLFSILLFGGVFGFVGMIIGVPTFAVFYKLVTELVTYLLGKRRLSTDIDAYDGLQYIDEEKKSYIKK